MTGGTFTAEAKTFLSTLHNPLLQKPFEPKELRRLIAALVAKPQV